MEQTPESRFARHYESLANQAAAQWLEALDDGIWNQLRRGTSGWSFPSSRVRRRCWRLSSESCAQTRGTTPLDLIPAMAALPQEARQEFSQDLENA